MKKQTIKLLERIFEFRHGYMSGQTRKLELSLEDYEGAETTVVYDYFLDDALIIIFWDNGKFYIAKH